LPDDRRGWLTRQRAATARPPALAAA